jgi:hypothetical protein
LSSKLNPAICVWSVDKCKIRPWKIYRITKV